jgi:hypothetical protein
LDESHFSIFLEHFCHQGIFTIFKSAENALDLYVLPDLVQRKTYQASEGDFLKIILQQHRLSEKNGKKNKNHL